MIMVGQIQGRNLLQLRSSLEARILRAVSPFHMEEIQKVISGKKDRGQLWLDFTIIQDRGRVSDSSEIRA